MRFDRASSGGKHYGTGQRHLSLPAAFRKVVKIRKGLKSNGTSNNARYFKENFFKENDSQDLKKTGRTALA